jgi:hypothetical protein
MKVERYRYRIVQSCEQTKRNDGTSDAAPRFKPREFVHVQLYWPYRCDSNYLLVVFATLHSYETIFIETFAAML